MSSDRFFDQKLMKKLDRKLQLIIDRVGVDRKTLDEVFDKSTLPGDLVIIKPWDIQDEKADVIFRYRRTQSVVLSRRKLLPEEIDVF